MAHRSHQTLLLLAALLAGIVDSAMAQESDVAALVAPVRVAVKFKKVRSTHRKTTFELAAGDEQLAGLAEVVPFDPKDGALDAVLELNGLVAKSTGTQNTEYRNKKGDRSATRSFKRAAAYVHCDLRTSDGTVLGSWIQAANPATPMAVRDRPGDRRSEGGTTVGAVRTAVLRESVRHAVARALSFRLIPARDRLRSVLVGGDFDQLERLLAMLEVTELRGQLTPTWGKIVLEAWPKLSKEKRDVVWRHSRVRPRVMPEDAAEALTAVREHFAAATAQVERTRYALNQASASPRRARANGGLEIVLVTKGSVSFTGDLLPWTDDRLRNNLSSTPPNEGRWAKITKKIDEPTILLVRHARVGEGRRAKIRYEVVERAPATAAGFNEVLAACLRELGDRMREQRSGAKRLARLLK